MTTSVGWAPKIRLATRPIRTTPAVCELLGPIITGPIISKMLLLSDILILYRFAPHLPKLKKYVVEMGKSKINSHGMPTLAPDWEAQVPFLICVLGVSAIFPNEERFSVSFQVSPLFSDGILIFFLYLYRIEICWAVCLMFYQLRAKEADSL